MNFSSATDHMLSFEKRTAKVGIHFSSAKDFYHHIKKETTRKNVHLHSLLKTESLSARFTP